MKCFYSYNPRLGSLLEENALADSVASLRKAHPEPLVQFLHVTLNNLSTLLVHHSVAQVASIAFDTMAHIVNTVQSLDLPYDKHERNGILASYLQYVFNAPQEQHSSGALDSRTVTKGMDYTCILSGSYPELMYVRGKRNDVFLLAHLSA